MAVDRWAVRCRLVAVVLAAGCGGGGGGAGAGGAFSCTDGFAKADGGEGPPAVCVEASGATPQDYESNRKKCQDQGSSFSAAPCTRADAVGGCRVSHGSETITTWYYSDSGMTTAADIQQVCAGLASVGVQQVMIQFVAP